MTQNPQNKKSRVVKLLQQDPSSINRNQLNNSPSKSQFSIPKAKRFKQEKNLDVSPKFYDLPDTKSKRSASLGYGNKMDLAKQYFIKPPPGKYQYRSQFDTNNKKKGITIAAGRQIVKNNSCFQIQKNIPGPGQYNPNSGDFTEGHLSEKKGFTLSSRNKDLADKFLLSVPGPGNYQTIQLLNKNLQSNNSRIRNVQSSRFSKQARKSEFEQKIRQNIPGPGQYSQADKIDKTAKFQLKNGCKFSHSKRQGIVQNNKIGYPGPGSYRLFSQFPK